MSSPTARAFSAFVDSFVTKTDANDTRNEIVPEAQRSQPAGYYRATAPTRWITAMHTGSSKAESKNVAEIDCHDTYLVALALPRTYKWHTGFEHFIMEVDVRNTLNAPTEPTVRALHNAIFETPSMPPAPAPNGPAAP